MHSISAVRFSDCEPGACPSAVWDWCLRDWSLHHLPSARVPSLRGWTFRTPRVLPCSSLSCSPYGLGVYLYVPYVNATQSSPTIGLRTCRHGYVSNGVGSASPLASSQTASSSRICSVVVRKPSRAEFDVPRVCYTSSKQRIGLRDAPAYHTDAGSELFCVRLCLS